MEFVTFLSCTPWLWSTNYWLDTTAGAHGSVDVADGWKAAGSVAIITATPDTGYHFVAWSGDLEGCALDGNEITAPMSRPRALAVTFDNHAPVAVDDGAETPEDTPVVVSVLVNDIDTEGSPLTVSSATYGAHGAVEIGGGAVSVTYSPSLNWNGLDSFTYTVSDGYGGLGTGTVNVTVSPVNDPPVAEDLAVSTKRQQPVGGTVSGADVDGDPLSYAKAEDPVHGSAAVASDGAFTYTPAPDYVGDDSFRFTVTDTSNVASTGTVGITIAPWTGSMVGYY